MAEPVQPTAPREGVAGTLEPYTRPLADAAQTAGQTIETAAENTMQYVNQGVENARTGFSNTIAPFASGAEFAGAAQDYLNSNSMIAKFAFVVLILFAFFALVNLGIMILGYFMQSPKNPYLIYGMIDGNAAQTISQDPRQNNASIVTRSNDQSTGMEFTWSVWLMVNDNSWTTDGTKKYLHVFNKGDVPIAGTQGTGVASVNNAPGLYFSTGAEIPQPEMLLHVIMDTVTNTPVTLDVSGVPFRQWFHVAVRLENTMMDVYINGTISGRAQILNVPKQNYQDVNVGSNGGFAGKISNLRYYAHALSAFEINGIVIGGPNTTTSALATTGKWSDPYYLSSQWYYNKM
jgi:hypothetical protein